MNHDSKEKKASIIAASVTFGVALIILILLFCLTIGDNRRALAESSIPEFQDEEEVFLEPELLVLDTPGDENAPDIDEAAPQTPGEPDPADEEQPIRVVNNPEKPVEKPVSNKPKLVADNKNESDLKTSTPPLSPEEERRIGSMAGKLKSDNNGSRTGKEAATSGSGGEGVSASGSVNGRTMLNCPTWKVKLTQKTTVKVSITVDADGNVTSATAVSGGTPALRKECEKMARGSKWTKKPGASPASGSISFTIRPQ